MPLNEHGLEGFGHVRVERTLQIAALIRVEQDHFDGVGEIGSR